MVLVAAKAPCSRARLMCQVLAVAAADRRMLGAVPVHIVMDRAYGRCVRRTVVCTDGRLGGCVDGRRMLRIDDQLVMGVPARFGRKVADQRYHLGQIALVARCRAERPRWRRGSPVGRVAVRKRTAIRIGRIIDQRLVLEIAFVVVVMGMLVLRAVRMAIGMLTITAMFEAAEPIAVQNYGHSRRVSVRIN